jgi:hypothetical protein
MIYLADRRLLFVKPKKVAGTSIEIALSCNAGEDDIVTPLVVEDEAIRHERGGQFPVNWAWLRGSERAYRRRFDAYLATRQVPRRWLGNKRRRFYSKAFAARYFNHITPAQIARRAPRGFLDRVFMVTIVRNPYEQTVSLAYYRNRSKKRPLDQIIEGILNDRPLNDDYLFADRRPDFVIRYEQLAEDLATLEERVGLRLVENLPFTKNTARKDRRDAREILTPDQRERCRRIYRRTFEEYGYAE